MVARAAEGARRGYDRRVDVIDLRSDTVTRPSPAMRAAMAAADVGDDQFGEDPTVNRLQDHVAELLGKEAALWVPTGTMANQVALRVLARPGDDVIVARESHAMWHETGAAGANAGIQFTQVGRGGARSPHGPSAPLEHPPTPPCPPPNSDGGQRNAHNPVGQTSPGT